MVEHRHAPFTSEKDPTTEIKAERISELDEKFSQPLVPGESRTFLPPEQGTEETISFHITQDKLINGTDPVPFSTHINSEGQWVVECPALPGESWTLPAGAEYSVTMNGVSVRTKKDIDAHVSPQYLPVYPSRVTQLMAAQARDAGAGHPGFIFMAHESADGVTVLSMRNIGRDTVDVERTVSYTELKEKEFEGSNDKTVIIGRKAIQKLDQENERAVSPEETSTKTQGIDMKAILDEGREATTDEKETVPPSKEMDESDKISAWEGEGGATSSGSQASQEIRDTAEPAPEIPERYRMRVALGDMTPEEAIAQHAADEEASLQAEGEKSVAERLILDEQLTLPEAIEKIVDHVGERLNGMKSSTREVFLNDEHGLLQALEKASRQGNSIEGSGVLTVLDELRVKFGNYGAEISQMREEIKKYLEAEESVYSAADRDRERSTQEEETEKLRKDTLEVMEDLDEALEKIDTINNVILERRLTLTSVLTNGVPTTTKYEIGTGIFNGGYENPAMIQIHEAVVEGMKQAGAMAEYLSNDRTPATDEALDLLEKLEELRGRLKAQAEA